jgi:hypothetical protein
MKALNLDEAAEFLRMTPEGLRRKAFRGEIPGRNTGRHWLFIEEHLADWISGRWKPDNDIRRTAQVIDIPMEEKPCRSTNAATVRCGGSSSPQQMEGEYGHLLGLKTKRPPRNSTTGSKPHRGAQNIRRTGPGGHGKTP